MDEKRQIKFRAWDADKKQMIIPEIIGLDYEKFVWCHNRRWLHNCQYWDGEDGFSDNFHLMQFTGLKDKNGKEIYEGDRLKRDGFSDWIVVWKDGGFHIYNDCRPSDKYQINKYECSEFREVSGNIYSNPELLES